MLPLLSVLASIVTLTDPPAFAHAAVAADHKLASEAGVEILKQGGNAVDAAVAVSLTLSVVRPESCGIGGGGFMLIHLAKSEKSGAQSEARTVALSFREQAFAKASATYYLDKTDPDASTRGGTSIAIPGSIAGLLEALETYGTLDRAKVFAPAIRAARDGFHADEHLVSTCEGVAKKFKQRPEFATRFAFLNAHYLRDGHLAIGDLITNPEQAAALELIARDGKAAFYEGPIAIAIVEAVKRDGGELTLDDLKSYRTETLQPFAINFRGDTILAMPPPSSGGIVVAEILGILDRHPQELSAAIAAGPMSAPYIHLVTEASKHGFADRARWLGDSASARAAAVTLTDPEYLDKLAARVNPSKTLAPERYGSTPPTPAPAKDDHGTSHFCVIDEHGNAVSCTETINLDFGSFLAVPGYGFMLNDQMDDFTARPGEANAFGLKQSDANAPGPGKRPLSSMTPLIVLSDDKVRIIAGASGGPRIISGTLQCTLKVLLFDQSAQDAVASPRFHHQWDPNVLGLEKPLFDLPVTAELKALGHDVRSREGVSHSQLIRVLDDGTKQPASDPRKGGTPAGY